MPSKANKRGMPAKASRLSLIQELLSYRLAVISSLLSGSAALRYRRQFGVSLWEWRTIALLGASSPASLNDLAKAAGLEKSQMSRVVSGLTARGLVFRGPDETDGRGVQLTLTRTGQRLYEGLIHIANERDTKLWASLPSEDRESLKRVLNTLQGTAKAMLVEERKLDGDRRER
jgi:DNA-binding MarR family transcriptional regulator